MSSGTDSAFRTLNIALGAACAALLTCLGAPGAIAAPPELAITIDDLPAHGPLGSGETRLGVAHGIIDSIKRNGLPPVYGFMNAEGEEEIPDELQVLKDWLKAGLPMGNHTWSHPDLHDVSAKSFNANIARDEPLLRKLAGQTDWHWFRYPFLDEGQTPEKRQAVRTFLAQRGYKIAWVTMDFGDWMWNDAYGRCAAHKDTAGVAALETSFLDAAGQNITYWRKMSAALYGRDIPYVLLLHIGAFDARMFDRLIALYRAQGFSFVTLEQAESDPVYAPYLDPAKPSAYDSLETAMDQRGLALPLPEDFTKKLNGLCRTHIRSVSLRLPKAR